MDCHQEILDVGTGTGIWAMYGDNPIPWLLR